MIVFCFVICLLIISLLTSSICVRVKKFQISDIDKLKMIYYKVDNKEYDKILNYINIEFCVEIYLFSIIRIKLLQIDSFKLKKLLRRIMIKENKEKQLDADNYYKKKRMQKKIIEKLKRKILSRLIIKEAKLVIKIGLANAGTTAIVTGILNATISIILLGYISEKVEITSSNCSSISEIVKSLNYIVEPVYEDDFYFQLETSFLVKTPLYGMLL